MQRAYTVAIDFDGTLCANKYPEIGEPNTALIEYLAGQRRQGWKIILWTCRTGRELLDAVDWCKAHGLVFDAVNKNLPETIQAYGGDTRKLSVDAYIDDRNMAVYGIIKPGILYP